MIDRQQVISLFEEMYGGEDCEGRVPSLCEAACLSVEAKMKKGADCADAGILMLAAALLNRRLISRIADEEAVSSFKAGDVTVSRKTGERLRNAESDVEQALALAAPQLRDDGFLFLRC